jgi:uncharacterized protein YbjT (DUF2867 family)
MNPKKIIAVAGATGAQGGGLVRAILNDPSGAFAARALTRDVNSPKARALAALGAEVVAADETCAVVAAGRITFVAVRGAARRLVTGMLAMNPPEVVRRVFPAYAR